MSYRCSLSHPKTKLAGHAKQLGNPSESGSQVDFRFPFAFGFVEMQLEADFFAHSFHCGVLCGDAAGDPVQTFFASDLNKQLEKLRTKTFPLPRVTDQNGKLPFVSSMFLDQTSDPENLVSAIRILYVGDQRDLAVVVDETNPAQALMHDACLKAHNSEIAKVNAAIGKCFVEFHHQRLVLRTDWTNGHLDPGDFSRCNVLDWIRPDCRSGQIRFAHLRIVQHDARIQRHDLFGRNEKRVNVDLPDPALFDHQLAEAHKQLFKRVEIHGATSAKTFFQRVINLRPFHQPARQCAIKRRKAQRAVLENFDKISACAEKKHRPELRVDAAAENQFVT